MASYGLFPAEIYLPKEGFETWSVVACDQYTSQQEYWDEVETIVGDAPSTLRLTLPEIYLNDRPEQRIAAINQTMQQYLEQDVMVCYPDAMIYVEREQSNGRIRRGLVGVVDLEQYDYRPDCHCSIRATEQTVLERIPPRVKIRRDAVLELPHVLLMVDDAEKTLIEPLTAQRDRFAPAYNVELMQGGGHINGWFLDDAAKEAVATSLESLQKQSSDGLLFVVGDGNHSLATAKECYRQNPTPLNRYALVEVVNIHDPSIEFEPIYRVLFGVDPADVMRELKAYQAAEGEEAQSVTCLYGDVREEVAMAPCSNLPVGTLQSFLDRYVATHEGVEIDYIHGVDVVENLSRSPRTIGFLFEGMTKESLFPSVIADGSLPRKTFSMGHACDKRYYMECRRIRKEG